MSLVEDKKSDFFKGSDAQGLAIALERWRCAQHSVLLHHGRQCCTVAREWTVATDYSQLNGEHILTGPRWLRAKYKWGPSKWPMTWCEAVDEKMLDCGALSALAREVFAARGLTAYPMQLIQKYTEQCGQHWSAKWKAQDVAVGWVQNALIYHEACAIVVAENALKIWDPSAGWWISPRQFAGYGRVMAVRLVEPTAGNSRVSWHWGTHNIKSNQWQEIEAEGYESEEQRDNGRFSKTVSLKPQIPHVETYTFETAAGGD